MKKIIWILPLLLVVACIVSCGNSSSDSADPDDSVPPETINGVIVPPDPGENGKLTIEGIDVNGNNIRDDVERFIAEEHGTTAQAGSANTYAQLIQSTLIAIESEREAVVLQQANQLTCIEFEHLLELKAIEAEMVNTAERFEVYKQAMISLGGHLIPSKNFRCSG